MALVTGGGTGLGLGIARALIAAGARVAITGRRAEVLREACREFGEAAAAFPHDIRKLETIPGLVERVEHEFGPLDILVNNAGNHLKKPATDVTDAEFAEVLQTHLFGGFALSRECARRMVGRRRGAIIMIASMASLFGIPQVSAYTAAKSALAGLVRSLAVDLGPQGVRVNAVAPGWFDTALSRRNLAGDPRRKEKILERTPLGRLGDLEDVGRAVVYLCSPAARFVTGVILPVDGGISIGF
jgi:gluconate 5-dehydrogenase